MTKFIALIIIALRLAYQPSSATPENTPFASKPPVYPAITSNSNPVNIINIAGSVSNNKIVLSWQVTDNESADQFLVEKSMDGKNFTTVALVFSSEKTDKENYQFYEKPGNGKYLYRVLLINKNKKSVHSPVVEIDARGIKSK
jgi:hypothetical protein